MNKIESLIKMKEKGAWDAQNVQERSSEMTGTELNGEKFSTFL